MVITTSSGEAIEVEINKYKMFRMTINPGNVKLRDILQEEKGRFCCYILFFIQRKEHNSGFTFSISVLIDCSFLSIYYNEKNGKNSLTG